MTHLHRHEYGQILFVEKGMLSLHIDHEQWTVAQGCLGWIPPLCQHEATMYGDVSGRLIYIDTVIASAMPSLPKVGRFSPFQSALIQRLIQLEKNNQITQAYIDVLTDEMNALTDVTWSLSLPKDHRALAIAHQIIATPDDQRTQQAWAEFGHLSVKTLSRIFNKETGMSFSLWKQAIRLHAALRYLSEGETVTNTAMACGYDNVSFFIKIFKEKFSMTPSHFIKSADYST